LLADAGATSLRASLFEAPKWTPAATSGKLPSAVSSTQPVQSPSGASERIFAPHFRQTLITLAIGYVATAALGYLCRSMLGLLGCERGHDVFKARIASQWVPPWQQLQLAIGDGAAWKAAGEGKLFAGEILITN